MSEPSVERTENGDSDSLESGTAKESDETSDASEMQFASFFGWVAGYFVLSGSVATFIYLKWLGIAPAIASALEPLGSAAIGILGVVAVFANLVLMGILLVNAEAVKERFAERGLL